MPKYVANLTMKEALNFMTRLVNSKNLRSIHVKTEIGQDNAKISLGAEDYDIDLLDTAFASGGSLKSWREKFERI